MGYLLWPTRKSKTVSQFCNRCEWGWLYSNSLDNGADIEIKSNDDTTPLIIVSCYDQLETVKLLIERSAVINAKTDDGNTAFSYA